MVVIRIDTKNAWITGDMTTTRPRGTNFEVQPVSSANVLLLETMYRLINSDKLQGLSETPLCFIF